MVILFAFVACLLPVEYNFDYDEDDKHNRARNQENMAHTTRYRATTGPSNGVGNGTGNTTKGRPAATFLVCCAHARLGSIEE